MRKKLFYWHKFLNAFRGFYGNMGNTYSTEYIWKILFLLKLVQYFLTFIRLLTKMSLILVEHLITEDSLTLNVPDMLWMLSWVAKYHGVIHKCLSIEINYLPSVKPGCNSWKWAIFLHVHSNVALETGKKRRKSPRL